MNVINEQYLIQEAASLLDPDGPEGNPEYARGMAELIARVCPVWDEPTDSRAEVIWDLILYQVKNMD